MTHPLTLFLSWLEAATASEPDLPEAAVLATVGTDGQPSARVILVKGADERGLAFYTHLDSRKSQELGAHPTAALVFHWKSLARQVRVEGHIEPVPADEADAYHASRPRGSQVAAWASRQSEPLADRSLLDQAVGSARARFEGAEVPRPPRWGGWRLVPHRWELWEERPHRLHERRVFVRDGSAWEEYRLYP